MDVKRRREAARLQDDPLWFKDAVIYQLHVKSFFDSNDDGIGDFRGLISRLDYIAELGVTAIWLLPFYPSPRRDDGYDIADYTDVHPDYGTLADFRAFVAAAHARGIRVITELVINHTSDAHPWFQRARRAKRGSVARDFYVWSDDDSRYAGTRIIFCDTEKSNWTWDETAGAFYWHRFYAHQPDLNFDNPAVLRAVISVMRFWLDLGVDGLRLDAVPYLIERDGTSNENLPETHAVLKRIRAALDDAYRNRMLIAEANQWPEDAQEYFGDGDECHMAFHFPLMPRMYMAIAQEDRFPVTDIMRQTPSIPAGCQWAIFLRNHDELTLEMVTDSERDYLWQVYAGDRRARLNLGIRRRLAPLLERDRRRAELMTSLLFSMPGTPVIYYGDEIGMGDNIHLGDRDGVRTPMQWSSDRNGGFSRADPERLVLPPIMDPVSGYGAVNVESQRRDAHSLLNWTRRMLAVRGRYAVFGRGTMRFLQPRNRKILAYLRESAEQTVLCVANLAHASQAVELDLAAFEGCVPVEMIGGTVFPPIGTLTYLLTLPPYGFYWFELRANPIAADRPETPPEAMPEYVTLVLRGGFDDLALAPHRHVLETEALPAYLPMRRWFASKHRPIASVRIDALLPSPTPETCLAELAVRFADGEERYLLPLGIAWDDEQPSALARQLALTRVRQGRRVGFLTDAYALERFARGLLQACGSTLRAEDGAELAFDCALPDAPGASSRVQWLAPEHSNSSLVVDERVFVKLYRRIEEDARAEAAIVRHVTSAGFANVPAYLGRVTRRRGEGTATLALLQAYLRNQGDGWTWAQDYFARTAYNLIDRSGPDRDEIVRGYAEFAATIGRRLGELHRALSNGEAGGPFAPAEAGADEVAAWSAQARERVEHALGVLAALPDQADADLRQRLAGLHARRAALPAGLDTLAAAGTGTACAIVHGDFHLGQVLVTPGDVAIVDFEGEPGRPPSERAARTSPLKDLAGILRSFEYAALAAARSPRQDAPDSAGERQALIAQCAAAAADALVQAYAAATGRPGQAFAPHTADERLLRLFLIEKAAYEVAYEAAHRPGWIDLPARGLLPLLESLLAEAPP